MPCWRAMLALQEKGVECEMKLVEFSKKEHKGPDVITLNHRGQMPTFRDGDTVVNESMAICLYLENTYKSQGTKLLPDDPKDAGHVFQTTFEAQENFQRKVLMDFVFYQWMYPKDKQDPELILKRLQIIRDEMAIWEKRMGESGYPFVCGSSFTLADVILFPYIAWIARLGGDMEKYPTLKAYYDRLLQRDSVQNTMPPHWKEGPPTDDKLLFKLL